MEIKSGLISVLFLILDLPVSAVGVESREDGGLPRGFYKLIHLGEGVGFPVS